MRILKTKTYIQPSGVKITLQRVRMVWSACTNLCVQRLVENKVQEGWYGWGKDTLKSIWDGWVQFEESVSSKPNP